MSNNAILEINDIFLISMCFIENIILHYITVKCAFAILVSRWLYDNFDKNQVCRFIPN